jgi:hypothetical protein
MDDIRTWHGTCFWSSSFLCHILAFCFLVIPVNTVLPSSSLLPNGYFQDVSQSKSSMHFCVILGFCPSHCSLVHLNSKWRMWSFLYNILHFRILFFVGPNTFLNILFCTLCSSFRIRNPISKPWIYKACSIQELVRLVFWVTCFFCEQVKCTMDCSDPDTGVLGSDPKYGHCRERTGSCRIIIIMTITVSC